MQPVTQAPAVCPAVNQRGGPCGIRGNLCAECGCCLWHCEHRKEWALEVRRRGGKHPRANKRTVVLKAELPYPLESVADCVRWARWITENVLTGMISPDVTNRALAAVKELRLSLVQSEKIEGRLKAIEKTLAERRAA